VHSLGRGPKGIDTSATTSSGNLAGAGRAGHSTGDRNGKKKKLRFSGNRRRARKGDTATVHQPLVEKPRTGTRGKTVRTRQHLANGNPFNPVGSGLGLRGQPLVGLP